VVISDIHKKFPKVLTKKFSMEEIEKKANLQPITNFNYLQPHNSIPCPGIIAVQTHWPAYTVAQRKIFKAIAFNSHT
jgi:hypothetical protein